MKKKNVEGKWNHIECCVFLRIRLYLIYWANLWLKSRKKNTIKTKWNGNMWKDDKRKINKTAIKYCC